MKIYTSNFASVKKLVAAGIVPVSISRGKPGAFDHPTMDELAPTWPMLKMSEDEYDKLYQSILDGQDAQTIYNKLLEITDNGYMDVALLCWENVDKDVCHRQYVAGWLGKELGITVEEWGKGDKSIDLKKKLDDAFC